MEMSPRSQAGKELCGAVRRLSPQLVNNAAENDRTGVFAAGSVKLLESNGVLASCAPVDQGGSGLDSLFDLTALSAYLAQSDPSLAVATYMHLALSWYFARTWSGLIGERRMIVCSAVAEPGVYPWELRTTAFRSADGWAINGRKVMASISPIATHFYTRLRVESDKGPIIGSVMIPRKTPSIEVIENWEGLGLRGSGSGEVIFRNCHVPWDAVRPRGTWGVRDEGSFEGRVAATAPLLGVSLGIAEAARMTALDYLIRQRADPHGPQTTSIGVGNLLAEIELRIAAARATLKIALTDFDEHLRDSAPRSLSATLGRTLMKECVSAGMIVERAAVEIVDMAMQICGGASFLWSHPLARLARDVKAISFMRPYVPANNWSEFLVKETLGEIT
jgi:alkylation response protein AidB-like acyl-CoA dehydrogenase